MNSIPVNLAVEDQLSEAVLRRILSHTARGFAIGVAYNRGGYGYLRRTVRGWNTAAVGIPFILLTDLNSRYECPAALIHDWLGQRPHPNLLFRVAVREVEAWLLADPTSLAQFLGISKAVIPGNVEMLSDPKAALIDLARNSRHKSIRDRIVPKAGSTARQGRDYNGCLTEFVGSTWDVEASSHTCPSLERALRRVRAFRPKWPKTRS